MIWGDGQGYFPHICWFPNAKFQINWLLVTLLLIWKPILWRFRMILTFGVECESNFSCRNTTAFCDALVKFFCTLAALGHIHFEHGIMVHLFLIFLPKLPFFFSNEIHLYAAKKFTTAYQTADNRIRLYFLSPFICLNEVALSCFCWSLICFCFSFVVSVSKEKVFCITVSVFCEWSAWIHSAWLLIFRFLGS